MALKWLDEKSVLRLDGEIYAAGDIIPASKLDKVKLEALKDLKQIGEGEAEKPSRFGKKSEVKDAESSEE